MRIFGRKRETQAQVPATAPHGDPADQMWPLDRGIPVFRRPTHALLHVLDHDWYLPGRDGEFVADVEPIGADPYRVSLHYRSDPDLVNGVVLGFPVPGLVDLAAPDHVILLEPPGGDDLPRVEAALAEARVERDRRTLELLRRYPAPTVEKLRGLLEPGALEPVSAFEAARFRLHLITTVEMSELLGRVGAAGEEWVRAARDLSMARPRWASQVYTDAASTLSHVSGVAPGGRDLDEQPLMEMLLALRVLDETPERVDTAALEVLMRPWTGVLGPVL